MVGEGVATGEGGLDVQIVFHEGLPKGLYGMGKGLEVMVKFVLELIKLYEVLPINLTVPDFALTFLLPLYLSQHILLIHHVHHLLSEASVFKAPPQLESGEQLFFLEGEDVVGREEAEI